MMRYFRGRKGLMGFVLWAYVHCLFASAFASQSNSEPDWILKIIPPSRRLPSQSSLSGQSGSTQDEPHPLPKLELTSQKESKKPQSLAPSSRKIIIPNLGTVSWTIEGTLSVKKSSNTPLQTLHLEGGDFIKNLVVSGHRVWAKGPSVYNSVSLEDGVFGVLPKQNITLKRYRHINSTLENQGHFTLSERAHFTKGSVINKDQWQGFPAKLSGTLDLLENGGLMTYALSSQGLAVKEVVNHLPGTLTASETIPHQGPLTLEKGRNSGDMRSTPHPLIVTNTFNNYSKWGVKRLEGIGRIHNFNSLKHLEWVDLFSLSNGAYCEGKQALMEFSSDKSASIALENFYNHGDGLMKGEKGITFSLKGPNFALNKGGLEVKDLTFRGTMPLKNQGKIKTDSLRLNDAYLLTNEKGGEVTVNHSTFIDFKDKNDFFNQGAMSLSGGVYPTKWVDVWHYSGQDPNAPFIRSSFEALLRKQSDKALPSLTNGSLKEAYETFLERNKTAPVTGKPLGREAVFLLRAFQGYRQTPTPALEKALVDWIVSGHGCGGLNGTETLTQDELSLYEDLLTTLLINAKYHGRVYNPVPPYPSYYRKPLWERVKGLVDRQPPFNWLNEGYIQNKGDLTLKNTKLSSPFGVINEPYSKEEGKGILRLEKTTLDHVHNQGSIELKGEGPLTILLGEKGENDFPSNTIHFLSQEKDAFIQAEAGFHHLKDSDGEGSLELAAQGTLLNPKTFFKAVSKIKSKHPFTWEIGDFGEGENNFATPLSKIILQNTNPITFKTPRFFIPAGLTLKLLDAPISIETNHFACLGELEVLLLKLLAKTGQMGRAPIQSGRLRLKGQQNQAILGKITSYGATDIEVEEAFNHQWGITESKGPLTITSKTNAIHIGDSVPGGAPYWKNKNDAKIQSAKGITLKAAQGINFFYGLLKSDEDKVLFDSPKVSIFSSTIEAAGEEIRFKSPWVEILCPPLHVSDQREYCWMPSDWNPGQTWFNVGEPSRVHTFGRLEFEADPNQPLALLNRGSSVGARQEIYVRGQKIDHPKNFFRMENIPVKYPRGYAIRGKMPRRGDLEYLYEYAGGNESFFLSGKEVYMTTNNLALQGNFGGGSFTINAIRGEMNGQRPLNQSILSSLTIMEFDAPKKSIDDNLYVHHRDTLCPANGPYIFFKDGPLPTVGLTEYFESIHRSLTPIKIGFQLMDYCINQLKQACLYPDQSSQEEIKTLIDKTLSLQGNNQLEAAVRGTYDAKDPFFYLVANWVNGQETLKLKVKMPKSFIERYKLARAYNTTLRATREDGTITLDDYLTIKSALVETEKNLTMKTKTLAIGTTKEMVTQKDGDKTIRQEIAGPQARIQTGGQCSLIAEERIAIEGALVLSDEMIVFDSPKTLIEGLWLAYEEETITHEEGLLSSKTTIERISNPRYLQSLIQAPMAVFKGNAQVKGTSINVPILVDSTEDGMKFKPSIATRTYYTSIEADTPLTSTSMGCEGWQEVMQPTDLTKVQYMMRTLPSGKILFESVAMHPELLEGIKGQYEQKETELKSWHREWCEVHQALPEGALPVLALAITVASHGGGATIASSLLGMSAKGLAAEMFAAGFSTLCTKASMTFLQTGDLKATANALVSEDGIRDLIVSVASAGILKGTNLAALEGTDLWSHLKSQGISTAVQGVLDVVVRGEALGKVLEHSLRTLPIQALQAYGCSQIGDLFANGKLTDLGKKALHGALGGITNVMLVGNRDGFVPGALASIAATCAFDALVDEKAVKQKSIDYQREAEAQGITDPKAQTAYAQEKILLYFDKQIKAAKIIGAAAGGIFFTKAQAEGAIQVAGTTIDNNCVKGMLKTTEETVEWSHGHHQLEAFCNEHPDAKEAITFLKALTKDLKAQSQTFVEGVSVKEDGFSFQGGQSLTITQEALTKLEKAYTQVEALKEAYPNLSAALDQTLTYTFYCLGKVASFSAGIGGATLGAPFGPGGMAGGFIGGYTLSEKLQEAIGQGIEFGLDQLSSIAASQAQTPEQAQRFQECVYNTGATALFFLGAKGGKGKGGQWKGTLANQGRTYIKQMEMLSGTQVHPKARAQLVANLKDREYTVLNALEKDLHTKKFKNQKFKDNLIAEWEQQTGQVWPTKISIDPNTGQVKIDPQTGNALKQRYQAHHIIPQQFGGPHAWWNMHPVDQPVHQGGVHGKGSKLNDIIKKAKQ